MHIDDKNVVVGPGIGQDAAVIRFGEQVLVFKTDPITFATDSISWYLVTINANDISCMGGVPKYMLVTYLLPEAKTTASMVEDLFAGLRQACSAIGVTLVGGHTEITHGLERPVAIGFMIGTLLGDSVIRSSGARPGDAVLLSKSIPIEAVSLIAREMPDRAGLDKEDITEAQNLIYRPGISIVPEARIALDTGGVSAMHDPTEGGLATGLHEISQASGCGITVYSEKIPVHPLAQKILPAFSIDPLGALASGSLLVCCSHKNAGGILNAWKRAGITGAIIGEVTKERDTVLYSGGRAYDLPVFAADEITKIFDPTCSSTV